MATLFCLALFHLPAFHPTRRSRSERLGAFRAPVDIGRALSALLLSVLIYFVAVSQSNAESTWQTSFSVPVEVVNVPAGLVVTQAPAPVHVDVRATQQAFSQLQP